MVRPKHPILAPSHSNQLSLHAQKRQPPKSTIMYMLMQSTTKDQKASRLSAVGQVGKAFGLPRVRTARRKPRLKSRMPRREPPTEAGNKAEQQCQEHHKHLPSNCLGPTHPDICHTASHRGTPYCAVLLTLRCRCHGAARGDRHSGAATYGGAGILRVTGLEWLMTFYDDSCTVTESWIPLHLPKINRSLWLGYLVCEHGSA